ncbi:MAG: SDR family oxidoreductase [Chlamydiae bacterium]|nr:SDR family oxidoreductase [Chlamydiota bacterium]
MNDWLITGASKGIGKEIALLLLEKGKKVMGISRHPPSFSHPNFSWISYDFKEINGIDSLTINPNEFEGVVFSHGYGDFKNLEEFSHTAIVEMVHVNLLSTIFLTKKLIPFFKQKEKGLFIFIGSEAALQGKARSSIYSASKFGLRGFVQSIRKECAKSKLKICLIQPGLTRTSFYDSLYFEPKKDEKSAIDPKEIAKLIPLMMDSPIGTCLDEIIINPQTSSVEFKN